MSEGAAVAREVARPEVADRESAITAFDGKYLSVTTFKRDGTPVATPVWFVAEDERLFVHTDAGSGKVKRIRANPHVTVAPCTARGRVRVPPVPAYAEILPTDALHHVEELLERKYRFEMIFIKPIRAIQRRLRRGAPEELVAVAITLSGPGVGFASS